MRSEREQLIKSSSSRAWESQSCFPSAMISFYLKVMSYGTSALGNVISSISMFHLLRKQGQVILATANRCNQSNWLPPRARKKEANVQGDFYGTAPPPHPVQLFVSILALLPLCIGCSVFQHKLQRSVSMQLRAAAGGGGGETGGSWTDSPGVCWAPSPPCLQTPECQANFSLELGRWRERISSCYTRAIEAIALSPPPPPRVYSARNIAINPAATPAVCTLSSGLCS